MGYTHYWTQNRSFTKAEWQQVSADIAEILKYAEHMAGISLADSEGKRRTKPEFSADHIWFNGVGDNSHETMSIRRKREKSWEGGTLGDDFCKTARKPYDIAVTAVLCYLATVTRQDNPATHEPILGTESHSVSSDGHSEDFLAGLDLAKKALPQYGNVLDIPMTIMQDERWCAPWVNDSNCKGFEVKFCIDGYGYVHNQSTKEWYRFESHQALAQFLDTTKRVTFPGRTVHTNWGSYGPVEENIWNAHGTFDKARHKRIGKAQAKVLSRLFPVDADHAHEPPAFVRPGQMPANAGRPFAYYVDDLLKQYAA